MAEPVNPTPLEQIQHHVKWTGYVLIGVLLGGQALLGTVLNAEGAADPTSLFINVFMFTWPLSVAVAIGIVGFSREPRLSKGWAPWIFVAVLAVVALGMAWAFGQPIIPDTTGAPPAAGLPYLVMRLVGSVLNGFVNYYTPLVTIGAFVVGGGISWIWMDVIDKRSA
jgi:hypothetical protein